MENEYDPRYQEGKIYKIQCNITGEVYIGSTIRTLEQRLSVHKTRKNCVSRNIINRGDYKIELIKDYPCNNLKELEEEESNYIRNNICINIQIPNRTQKEWREDNKEKLSKKQKEYQEEHKDEISKKKKKYYEDNKDEISKTKKKYHEKNKEKISEKKKEKITCECGAIVAKSSLAKHKRSMKHIKLTECLIID